MIMSNYATVVAYATSRTEHWTVVVKAAVEGHLTSATMAQGPCVIVLKQLDHTHGLVD